MNANTKCQNVYDYDDARCNQGTRIDKQAVVLTKVTKGLVIAIRRAIPLREFIQHSHPQCSGHPIVMDGLKRRLNKQQHLLTTAATSSKHSGKQVIARVISRGRKKKKKTSTINKHTTNNKKQHNNNNRRRNYKRTVIKKATPSIKFLKYKYKYRQPKHYYHNYSYKLIVHMRGHRPTTRGNSGGGSSGGSGTNNTNTRRRRTLSGGRPLPQTIQNLETIVESPATLNPNTAEWWRRRTSIDSSGEY